MTLIFMLQTRGTANQTEKVGKQKNSR